MPINYKEQWLPLANTFFGNSFEMFRNT